MPEGLRPLRHLFAFWMFGFARCLVRFLPALDVLRLRARPKGFPVALWKPSGPYLAEGFGEWEAVVCVEAEGLRVLG